MKNAPWRQLAPLAVVVLAAHLVLLERLPRRLQPARLAPVQFVTRVIAAPAPPAAAVASVAAEPPRPVAAAPKPRVARPAPRIARLPDTAAVPQPAPATPPATPPAAPAAAPLPDWAAAAGTPLPPQVLAIPAPARLHYEVSATWRGIPVTGSALLDWRLDGQQYAARLEITSPAGSRVERSTGRITDAGLAPNYYAAKGSRSEQATHFDRENGRLVFSNNHPQAPLAEGMQDRLSVLVQLSVLVGGDPTHFPPGTQIAIPTADTNQGETWVFSVEGEEDLDLPGGQLRALKLQRLPRREFDQKVELWLAPRMDYAPVRLRLTNPNGDTVDNRWSSTDKG
jgi:hypothetical protein